MTRLEKSISFLSQIEFFFLLAKGEISSENHLISNTVKNFKMDCKIDLKGIFQDTKIVNQKDKCQPLLLQ